MRPFVSYFTIQRLTDLNGTEYYMTADQWSSDREDAEEFRTEGKAWRRADRVGGVVCKHQRMATAFEAAMLQRPSFQFSQAAE